MIVALLDRAHFIWQTFYLPTYSVVSMNPYETQMGWSGDWFLRFIPETLQELLDDGHETREAKDLLAARDMLYGVTRFRRYQRAVRSAAARLKHPLAVLRVIATTTARIEDEGARWRLRAELIKHKLPARAIRSLANKRIRQVQPKVREENVHYTNFRDGKARLTITADSTTIADLRAHVREIDDVKKLLGDEGTLDQTKGHVTIVMTVDEYTQVMRGEGDEVRLRMTNGAVINGADLFNRALGDYLNGVLFKRGVGPINAYRTERLANEMQRVIAHAENPTCAWDGCNIPATECQIHHLVAWDSGGFTNAQNLATACKFHNAINDDKRIGTGRGYLARRDGVVQRCFD